VTKLESGAINYRCVEASLIEQWLALCGSAYEWNSGGRDQALAGARHALERWLDLGLPSAQSEQGVRLFDPAEVLKFAKMAALTGRDRYWYEKFVTTGRNLVREFHDSKQSEVVPPPSSLPPKSFRMRLSRQFNLDNIEPSRRLLLRLPVPLEDRGLHDLRIESTSSTAAASEPSYAAGRLEWRLAAGREQSITISAEYTFIANASCGDPEASPLSAEEVDIYTRPREGLISVNSRIAALAKRIAGPEPDHWLQVQRIWNFILDNFTCCLVHYDQIGAANPSEWVLDNGVFDCQLGCALLISHCRSLGIPARLASGYLLYSVAPTYHYWAETFIVGRGWVPIDLACWDLSAGGKDEAWRIYFFGALDYRCKTESLPRHFTGLSTIRLGTTWQMLQLPVARGVEARFLALDTGRPIYCDRVITLPPHAQNFRA
jgi:hypothetical protein